MLIGLCQNHIMLLCLLSAFAHIEGYSVGKIGWLGVRVPIAYTTFTIYTQHVRHMTSQRTLKLRCNTSSDKNYNEL